MFVSDPEQTLQHRSFCKFFKIEAKLQSTAYIAQLRTKQIRNWSNNQDHQENHPGRRIILLLWRFLQLR